ncbi:MAG: hypothetical protein Q4D76_17995 [Oscillospiraceae bacterium]|nr:hypothetical protein [Oscillospiraceae bacterium]
MKFQQLKPWIMGNESITPMNYYEKIKPCIEMGAYIGLDVCVDLYLANTIDTGNLHESWVKNKEYIEKVCEITGTGAECGYDLDDEEKRWVLEELGEPPTCCYNIYFVSIYNDNEEKLVYVGKTDSQKSRFVNGHLVALKLHNPQYHDYYKRIYFGTVMFLSETREYVPLEFITPFQDAKRYLGEMEAFLIDRLQPELNVKNEKVGKLEHLGVVHIQNFSDVSDFMNDYFIY